MLNEVIQVVTQPSWVEYAMFGVTTLYLLATFGVFLANRKMAKAAEDQIKTAMTISDLSRKVELFDKRRTYLDLVEDYIQRLMPSWDNDTSKGKLFYDYSDIHVLALFDEDILMYWKQLKAEDEKLIILHGDYECAIKSINYKGKSIDVIINEIDSILSEVNKQFQVIKTMALDRYLKL